MFGGCLYDFREDDEDDRGGSAVRAMFEEGTRMAAQFGRENVYDFSLGNPNILAPGKVREAIIRLARDTDPMELHGYMSNAGYPEVRAKVAASLNRRFGTAFDENNIITTVGAAGGLNVILKTLLDPGDEVLVFAPYFLERADVLRPGTLPSVVGPYGEEGSLRKRADVGIGPYGVYGFDCGGCFFTAPWGIQWLDVGNTKSRPSVADDRLMVGRGFLYGYSG